MKRMFARRFADHLSIGLAWVLAIAAGMPADLSAAPQSKSAEKKPKSQVLSWAPPDVDGQIRALSSSPVCVLPTVLEKAGARATELVSNLENFTAQEKIEYRALGHMGNVLEGGVGTFDYTATFQRGKQEFGVQEARTSERGTPAFPASTQDVGLPEMALIFLPDFQGDYEMKCEGAVDWNGWPTWVVHFRQRKDRPGRTTSFNDGGVQYSASLKGRAWITQDTGEVVHLETSLIQGIPKIGVNQCYLSIDYAPVQFRTRNVQVWLPQSASSYGDFENHRSIISHTFSHFLLFSVQTNEVVDKPKTP